MNPSTKLNMMSQSKTFWNTYNCLGEILKTRMYQRHRETRCQRTNWCHWNPTLNKRQRSVPRQYLIRPRVWPRLEDRNTRGNYRNLIWLPSRKNLVKKTQISHPKACLQLNRYCEKDIGQGLLRNFQTRSTNLVQLRKSNCPIQIILKWRLISWVMRKMIKKFKNALIGSWAMCCRFSRRGTRSTRIKRPKEVI